ncbi:hypothetical protein KFL_002830260 [Klebsormidium nitens]|uniref:Uncharacterized protein n=1 Tax=Klebsormidium nitens TaxID=105231 RepID=A0A1Y1IA91_KLENI|nr:hypothetical protein KFL_002830260 [Klebsormidium nitens]|eukprot:GAQ86349.1 hypothetical protein KFL_002830260 [Klebsormidium nitens]
MACQFGQMDPLMAEAYANGLFPEGVFVNPQLVHGPRAPQMHGFFPGAQDEGRAQDEMHEDQEGGQGDEAAFDAHAANQQAQAAAEEAFGMQQLQHLFQGLSDNIIARVKGELTQSVSASVQDAVSSTLAGKKRRAEAIKNDGIKKQFVPLEEACLRMEHVKSSLKNFTEGETEEISHDDAVKMQDRTSWMKKQLKRTKKDFKAEEKEKESKKKTKQGFKPKFFQKTKSFYPRGGFSVGRGGGFYQAPGGGKPCYSSDAESLHLLSDFTGAAEFEGSRRPSESSFSKPTTLPSSSSAPPAPREPWLRNRLRDQLSFWRTICTSAFVLSIISVGYQLPWLEGPPPGPSFKANHPSAFQFPDFVSDAVASLVVTGAAQEVFFKPFIISPLGVVPKGVDKLRLILDLRCVNSFLRVDKFKYESETAGLVCTPLD